MKFCPMFAPSNQNSGDAPEHIYIYIYIYKKFGWCDSKFKSRLKSKYRNYNVGRKVNYPKDKAS